MAQLGERPVKSVDVPVQSPPDEPADPDFLQELAGQVVQERAAVGEQQVAES